MKDNKKQHFVGIAMLLGLILPHSSFLLMAINPLLVLLLFLFVRNNNNGFGDIKVLICSVVIISLLSSIGLLSHTSNKYIFASSFFLLLIACFPFVGKQKIPDSYYYVFIILILFSQFVYLFNVPSVQRLIENLYPAGESELNSFEYMTQNINTNNISQFRLGGIYINGNQTARYVCLVTAAFLADRPDESLRKTILFILLALISVFVTGSRTGLVVIALIVGVHVLRNHSIPTRIKTFFFTIALVVVIPLFISGSSSFRGFNVKQGFNDSANHKWYVLMDYLSQDNSFFHLLFGYADPDVFVPSRAGIMKIFDSEYGDMIYCYGFLGFFFVILFYIRAAILCPKKNRLFFIVLFWAITSTVLLSYRMSFLFMLYLSHFICDVRSEKPID